MASDRQTIRAEVKFCCGNNTAITDAMYDTFVQRAYAHITQTIEFPEGQRTSTWNTADNTSTYDLPSDFFSIYSARNNATNLRMHQVSVQKFEQLSTDEEGSPDRYAIYGEDATPLKQILVWPEPTGIEELQIRYRRIFPELSLDTDTHLLPNIWDQGISHLATAFAMDYVNELERSAYYRRTYAQFARAQEKRIDANLFDMNEALNVLGGEIR